MQHFYHHITFSLINGISFPVHTVIPIYCLQKKTDFTEIIRNFKRVSENAHVF